MHFYESEFYDAQHNNTSTLLLSPRVCEGTPSSPTMTVLIDSPKRNVETRTLRNDPFFSALRAGDNSRAPKKNNNCTSRRESEKNGEQKPGK